jgi:hypothetical protein
MRLADEGEGEIGAGDEGRLPGRRDLSERMT